MQPKPSFGPASRSTVSMCVLKDTRQTTTQPISQTALGGGLPANKAVLSFSHICLITTVFRKRYLAATFHMIV